MQFLNSITTFFFVLLSAFAFVNAAPVDIAARDVFVPPITYPTAGVVWTRGEVRTTGSSKPGTCVG
jgi:hypothetical protein